MALILATSINYYKDVPNGNARIAYDLAHGFAGLGHEVWYLCEDASGVMPEMESDGAVKVLRYRITRRKFTPSFHSHCHAIAKILGRFLPNPPDVVHGHAHLQYLAVRKFYEKAGFWCYIVHSPVVEEMRIVWGAQGWPGRFKTMAGMPWLRRTEAGILRWSDAVVGLSEYTRILLANRYGRRLAERAKCIPGWTDPKEFHPLIEPVSSVRARLGWPEHRRVLFLLRRLEKRTGVDNFLRALDIVRRAGHDFYAVIGGSGSQEGALRDLCDRLGLDRQVLFMGRVAQDLLPLAYGACDASVIPTAQLECFGIIALEALSCGRPVLVTPVGALPELIKQFEPAWISKNNQPEGIAELLCNYLDGALPAYNRDRFSAKLEYYSLNRALVEYSNCMGF